MSKKGAVKKQSVDVVALTRLKHGLLRDVVTQLGSQAALARELKVSPGRIGEWCNFKSYPREGRVYEGQTFRDIEKELFRVTGKLIDDLWPPELREAIDQQLIPQKVERRATLQTDALLEYAKHTQARLTYDPETPLLSLDKKELKERIQKVLHTLSYREREVIKLRYGLTDEYNYTLDEVAHIFGVGRERIRQVEAKALRKLQQPSRSSQLVEF